MPACAELGLATVIAGMRGIVDVIDTVLDSSRMGGEPCELDIYDHHALAVLSVPVGDSTSS